MFILGWWWGLSLCLCFPLYFELYIIKTYCLMMMILMMTTMAIKKITRKKNMTKTITPKANWFCFTLISIGWGVYQIREFGKIIIFWIFLNCKRDDFASAVWQDICCFINLGYQALTKSGNNNCFTSMKTEQ